MRIARPAGRDPERIIERRAQRRVPRSRRVIAHDRERVRLLISERERRDSLQRCGEEFVIVGHQSHPSKSAASSFVNPASVSTCSARARPAASIPPMRRSVIVTVRSKTRLSSLSISRA